MMPIRKLFLVAAAVILAAPAFTQDRQPEHPRPLVAVVLSGGAALGFAHVGALQVIEEMGIPVDIVVGASMGAIVGGLYAAGYSPADMERIASRVDWRAGFDETMADSPYGFREREVSRRFPLTVGFDTAGVWAGKGLLSGQSITTLLEILTLDVSSVADFDRLPRVYRSVAADISSGQQVVLGHGRLADAMRASATIPLLFRPFILDGRPLVDGGVVNRLPTDVARALGADIVIAVDVRETPSRSAGELRTMVDVLGQVSTLLLNQDIDARRALADVVITPDLSGFRRLDFASALPIIRRGQEETRKYSAQLRAIAERVSQSRSPGPATGQPGTYASLPASAAGSLVVNGASADSGQAVRRIFSPLVGSLLAGSALQDAVDEAYQTGRFEEIRVGLAPAGGGGPGQSLVVDTVPLAPPKVSALFGFVYEGSLSQEPSNSLVVSPGIIVRDLSGKGSQLIVDARLVDSLGGAVEYFQPLGRRLFLDGFGEYLYDRELFLIGDSAQAGRLQRGPSGGFWVGSLIGQAAEIKAGLQWSASHYLDPSTPVALDSSAAVAGAWLILDTRPAAAFPSAGAGFSLGYEQALPELGGTEAYKKLSLDGAVSLPVAAAFTVGFSFSGGTDFTLSAAAPGALGPQEAFSLRTESQFRGFQEWEIRGSHKLAAGLDLQLRLPWLNQVIGTDAFALANLSVGNCWTDPSQIISGFSVRTGASLGLGVRIRRDFEIATRVCWVDTGRVLLAVDVGSFALDEPQGL
jgi:NTE family protein